jgi:hypothetical protein
MGIRRGMMAARLLTALLTGWLLGGLLLVSGL